MGALLDGFLRPRRIALVGASRDPASVTARPLRYLRELGFAGEVVVVHPTAGATLAGRQVVPHVRDAAGADVAMVLVPAEQVVATLGSCAEAGIDRAVVIASGFEGESGAIAHDALVDLLDANPTLRILGPNSNGSLSIKGAVPLTFSSVLLTERPRVGRVALVMQSGAIGNAILLALARRGAGLSHLFSTGDELSIGSIELATALLDEDDTDVIGMFLEGITDPAYLIALGEAVARTGKTVVAFRTAASAGARRAAFGHTGRILGDDELARAALRAAGIQLVGSVEELCDVLTVLSVIGAPPKVGPVRVGVVTVSGGAGVIAAEAIGRAPGLSLEPFSGRGLVELEASVPGGTTVTNPLDVPTLGSPEVFPKVLLAAAGAGCDAVVAVVTTLAHDYDALSTLAAPVGTAMILTHLSPEERFSPEQARRLAEHGVATIPAVTSAIAALGIWTDGIGVSPQDDGEKASGHPSGESLGLVRGSERLTASVRRHLPKMAIASDRTSASLVATGMGFPVAIKAEGTTVPHRTERGAVAVSLRSAEEVSEAFERVASASAPDDVVVQAMAVPGIEVFVSVIRDPEVGVAAIVRGGGVLVELGSESVVLTGIRAAWRSTLQASGLGRVLEGWRGAPPADLNALLVIVGDLVDAVVADPSLMAVECNPVLVHSQNEGATVVDLLVREESMV